MSPEQRKAMEFTLSNGVKCGITYNKTYNKAKIESEFYSGLCYIFACYSSHVKNYNATTKSNIEMTVEIPL